MSLCESLLCDQLPCTARSTTERWDGRTPINLCNAHGALWDEYRSLRGIIAARARILAGIPYRHQPQGAITS